MEGQSFIRRCVKEKSLELEESRKRSIGDQRSIRCVRQLLFRHTGDSPIDRHGRRKR